MGFISIGSAVYRTPGKPPWGGELVGMTPPLEKAGMGALSLQGECPGKAHLILCHFWNSTPRGERGSGVVSGKGVLVYCRLYLLALELYFSGEGLIFLELQLSSF